MKKISLLLLLFVAGAMNAQIVNIPDAAFKAKLLSADPNSTNGVVARDINNQPMVIDANNDGEIQVAEAQAVYYLQASSLEIISYQGIEAFINVKSLVCSSPNVTQLDVTALTNLESLGFHNSQITSINLLPLVNLKYLYMSNDLLTSLDVTGLTNLVHIECDGNQLTGLTLNNLPNLMMLKCNGNQLTNLTLSNLPSLVSIDARENNLQGLDFTNVDNVHTLLALQNPFVSLDLSVMPNLSMFYVSESQLTQLDLSSCPNISSLFVADNPLLESISLKNGNLQNTSEILFYNTNTSLHYICVDEGEQAHILDRLAFTNTTGVQVNTYCSVEPGGNYNTITGTVTFDGDGNGCNALDDVLPLITVTINDGTDNGSAISSTGSYSFYTQSGTFTLTPQFENDWFTTTPAIVTFVDNNYNVTIQNFCVTANGIHNDVSVVIVPIEPARPGFDAVYKIIYTNNGNQTLNGDVTFTYDDTVLDYVSASPLQNTLATGLLTWNYSNLQPFERREIIATLNVNSPMETPAVNIDDPLDLTALASPATGDETPFNNTFAMKQIVVGAYDPNDITCLEGETVHPEQIGQYLHYNINFENTGNYPATFVVVKDMIDEQEFDVSSLRLIDASHDVKVRITGNKVEFYFDDINLAANGGKGNVVFKIKTLNTLAVNSDVTQQAEIYFDYNWPIITDEATTLFSTLGIDGFGTDGSVKIYPNPVKDVVNITSVHDLRYAELYDVQGRLLQSVKISGNSAGLDISARARGIYFVKIVSEKGAGFEKVIKL
ncbi:hypothetical protein AM493_18415 [Flavobacterium akiainvivens]|uniref:Uncharacterized protein n=1 Tax=Flavobacterium akiainvivens TaxID=1202724 RepID=A0A0M8MDB3_9FLAO|nr:T9SS type A sorting domain-containing protein [Flavobacterium akiainvivens]KOS07805.1 hypothetical protein AM493_18415 [Flavobacterium akiainvivens]SFQ26733.1 conserved repeat domain-containing protein/Por secretion system C-terminal sorting domain-containing protein [Flavobacterium akiainvivens]